MSLTIGPPPSGVNPSQASRTRLRSAARSCRVAPGVGVDATNFGVASKRLSRRAPMSSTMISPFSASTKIGVRNSPGPPPCRPARRSEPLRMPATTSCFASESIKATAESSTHASELALKSSVRSAAGVSARVSRGARCAAAVEAASASAARAPPVRVHFIMVISPGGGRISPIQRDAGRFRSVAGNERRGSGVRRRGACLLKLPHLQLQPAGSPGIRSRPTAR